MGLCVASENHVCVGKIGAKKGPIVIEVEVEVEMLSQRQNDARETTLKYLYLECTPVHTAAGVTRLKVTQGVTGWNNDIPFVTESEIRGQIK